MEIEFKEISLTSSNYLQTQQYPSTGFFCVTQNDTNIRVIVFNGGAMVWHLIDEPVVGVFDSYAKKQTIEDSPKSSVLSEELFLKTLSLVVNKDESYKE